MIYMHIHTHADVLAEAPPCSLDEKLAYFCKTELVYDSTKCVIARDMIEAVSAFLERNGEAREVTINHKVLAAMTKIAFDTAFIWMPVLRGVRYKVRPAYEKCTLASPEFKNKFGYCRVTLKTVPPKAEAVALSDMSEAEAQAAATPEAEAVALPDMRLVSFFFSFFFCKLTP